MPLLPVILSLGLACSHHAGSAVSTSPAVSLYPWSSRPIHSLLCQILFRSWPVEPEVSRRQLFPSSTTVPGSWLLMVAGCTAQPGAAGTETRLGAMVRALWRLLPKEDILNSSKCTAQISAGLGSGSSRCCSRRSLAACSQVPCRWAGSCPHIHMPRTLIFIHTLTDTCSHSL